MKKVHSTISFTAAFMVVGILNLQAEVKQTFTGRVNLTGPSAPLTEAAASPLGVVPGAKLANVAFSGTIRAQGTEGVDIDPATPGSLLDIRGALVSPAQRVSNKAILTAALGEGNIKGYTLRVIFFYKEDPVIQAYRKATKTVPMAVVNIDPELLGLDVSWPVAFDGVFKGTASYTVLDTVSGTSVVMENKKGFKFTGFNTYLGHLNLGGADAIVFSGAGPFTETFKGFSGNANVAGDNYTPPPSF